MDNKIVAKLIFSIVPLVAISITHFKASDKTRLNTTSSNVRITFINKFNLFFL